MFQIWPKKVVKQCTVHSDFIHFSWVTSEMFAANQRRTDDFSGDDELLAQEQAKGMGSGEVGPWWERFFFFSRGGKCPRTIIFEVYFNGLGYIINCFPFFCSFCFFLIFCCVFFFLEILNIPGVFVASASGCLQCPRKRGCLGIPW